MTIVAECPQCESRFNLQPDMLGKSMRCPNLSCRTVFTVKDVNGSSTPLAAPAVHRKESRPQDMPSLDLPLDLPPTISLPAAVRPVEAKVVEAKVVEAKVVEARVISQPREVEWSASAKLPPGRQAATVIDDAEDDEPLRPRRKKRRNPMILVWLGVAGIVWLLAVSGVYVVRHNMLGESRLVKEADAHLKAGEFPAAAKAFQQLLDEYPGSSDAPRYHFGADLASMRAAAQSVANREDPFPALEKFKEFAGKYRESEFAKPQSGLGGDVFAGGAKIADDLADHARDRLEKYRASRGQDAELARAERAVNEGRSLKPLLEPFRDPETPLPESLKSGYAALEREIHGERERAAFLVELRAGLQDPSDESIAEAETQIQRRGLGNEADVKQIIEDARGVLRGLVKYVARPVPAQPAAPATGFSLLFATPVGRTNQTIPAAGETPGTFLALAHGVLYALDERKGTLLWAQRVGSDTTLPPTRYRLEDGGEELALVTSDIAGAAGLTARRVRTGEALWHQPLPAAAAGPALIAARRIYVPTRDARGTIVEFDLGSGAQLGTMALGQPLGPAAVHRPGTGLIYVPADARRVFVLDVDARNDDGVRLPPQLVQVLATGHPPGTMRTPPVVIGPEGIGPEPHWLVLSQTNGPRSSRLLAFRLPEDASEGAKPPATFPEMAPALEADIPIAGWPWFAPAFDGERLAIVSDAGQFRLFGVGQPGAQDKPLYPIAAPQPATAAVGDPTPGIVAASTDDVFWVLASGAIGKLRLMLDPAHGQVLRPLDQPTPLGMPTQPARVNAARDMAFFVVRAGGYRAIAWDLVENRLLWTRQLGLVTASPPVALESALLFADEEGGLTLVPREALDPQKPGDQVADPAWTLAAAPADASGPTILLPAPDGAAWAITPHDSAFTIRRVQGGKVTLDTKVNAPARLAGAPIDFNQSLLLPLADGFVHRLDVKGDRIAPGPTWRDARLGAEATCYLAPVHGTEFLASDGNREFRRWTWPANGPADGSDWKRLGERILSREPIATAPRVLPNAAKGGPVVLFADRSGSAWLHSLASGEVLQRWRSGGTNPIPLGTPSSGIIEGLSANAAAFIVDGRALVVIDPAKKTPAQVAAVPEGASGAAFVGNPTPTPGGTWLAVDLAGRCGEFGGAPLDIIRMRRCGPAGALPVVGGTLLDGKKLVVPLADGSISIISVAGSAPIPLPAPVPREAGK